MSNSADEIMISQKVKRGRNDETEIEENKDMLSDLPDCVLLHVLSFLNAKYAVQTCVCPQDGSISGNVFPPLYCITQTFQLKRFSKFVSRILSHRDGSIALQGLDFKRTGSVEPHLLKRIVNFVISHNVQRLGLSIECDIAHILPCFSSSQTLTSLELYVTPKSVHSCSFEKTLFPKSLNLPALTRLHLGSFDFCASDNGRAEPFSTFDMLNTLTLHYCSVRDTQTLCISSRTLVNLTMQSHHAFDFSKIELSAPSLCSFAFNGVPHQKLCGNNLSSVELVNIDAEFWPNYTKPPLVILSWLRDLANIKSLTVTASTLQILSLVPDLSKIKLPSLHNLKSLKVKLKPIRYGLAMDLRDAKIEQVAAKSRKEAAKLRKAYKAGLEPSSPIPDGIVDFLLQNSPSAKVDIIDYSRSGISSYKSTSTSFHIIRAADTAR